MNARQSGGSQKLRETALGLPGFQWNAVQQQLVAGNSQQKAAFLALRQPILQFRPSRFKLAFGPLMFKPIQANVLYQDIEAMHESACRGITALFGCVDGRNTLLLCWCSG